MHELAVCQGLIGELERVARAEGATRVLRARLRIGVLSGVEPPLLERAFAVARAGSVAADAVLEIDIIPVTVACTVCGASGSAAPNRQLCPACGSWRVRTTGGCEMVLGQVELACDAGGPARREEAI